jgi:aryl-alcohol dehydrogenase-like predicted oxidoreductase
MLEGRATAPGTSRYKARLVGGKRAVSDHFHPALSGLELSSLGIGTYLGEPDGPTDASYEEAIRVAIEHGINVIDCAINYRYQRSERSIGSALERSVHDGIAQRDEIVLSTKGGYVPFDGAPPRGREELRAYLKKTFFDTGVCRPEEMAAGGQHCMTPRYLEHQIAASLANLRVRTIDVYFIHNPEGQLEEIERPEFERRIRAAFEALERAVAAGKIGVYGAATWNGFRAEPDEPEYLGLERLLALAKEVGGDGHHFRVIQLPYSFGMMEARARTNQAHGGRHGSILAAAHDLGVAVYTSASILQGRLARIFPSGTEHVLGRFETNAQRAIQWVRSTPGVTSALVGMKQATHVEENAEVAKIAPANAGEMSTLIPGA